MADQFGQEEIEQVFTDQLDEEPDPVVQAEEAIDEESEQPTSDTESEPVSPPTGPAPIRVGEREYTTQQLETITGLVDWANEDPKRWDDLVAYAEGQAQVIRNDFDRQQTQPAREPEFDYTDPDVAQLATRMRQLERYIATTQQQDVRSALNDATSRFRESHADLDDAGFAQVTTTAAQLKLIAAIGEREPHLSRQQIAEKAFETAYKIAFYSEAQSKTAKQTSQQVVTDMRRRRRAAASGASSVSATRTEPEPTTREEREAAMIREIADAISGN